MGIDRRHRTGLLENARHALAVDPQQQAGVALVLDRLRKAGDGSGVGLRLGQPFGGLRVSDLQQAVGLLIGVLVVFGGSSSIMPFIYTLF